MIRKIFHISTTLYLLGIAAIWLDGATTGYQPSEYAVVLGNQVYPSGEPSERLKARLDRAAELFRDGTVAKIIVSGGLGKESHDEAIVMKQYLQTAGVPEVAIYTDSYGNNTHDTAINAAGRWAQTNKPVIAVSQLYHLSRTKLAFKQAGFTQVGVAYPQYFEWRDVYASLRELPAWINYHWGRYGQEPACEDLLEKIHWSIPGLEYQSCKREYTSQTHAIAARYRVEGKRAAAVEQFILNHSGMEALRFACCGWEIPAWNGLGKDIPSHPDHYISMGSEETLINQREYWGEIPYFYVTVRHVYWEDI